MRRLSLAIASLLALLTIAPLAHATGNLIVGMGRDGQFVINGTPVGVPRGTTLDVCTARSTGACVVLSSQARWALVGQPVLLDATGKPLDVLTTVRLDGQGRVTEELVQVSERGHEVMRVQFTQEGVVHVLNG